MPEQPASNIIDMRARVEERRRLEQEELPEPSASVNKSNGSDGIDPDFIESCLRNNERGDGVLLAALMRNKLVFVKRTGRWMSFNGVHWVDDKRDVSHSMVEEAAKAYLGEAERLQEVINRIKGRKKDLEVEEQNCLQSSDGEGAQKHHDLALSVGREMGASAEKRKAYMKRVDRLRSNRGAKNCLEWSHKIGSDSLAIVGDEIDQKPWLLPCQNGVVCLKSGKLLPGNPEDYLVSAVPVDFPECQSYLNSTDGSGFGFTPWINFISEIHRGDMELVDFVHKMFGYSITGLTTEHFIGTFVGDGRNGKGTMFETIKAALGELAWAIQPELILDQKNTRSTAGPSADLMSLYGKRFVIASETDAGQKISAGRVKRFTGGDTITARSPHDRFEINITPTWTLFLYTNDIPHGLTKDFALRQRLLFIKYPLRYVPDPEAKAADDPNNADIYRAMDKDLPDRLRGGLSWVLAWLVRGCMLWQRDGLEPPDSIKNNAEELALMEDPLEQFIQAACDTKTAPPEGILFSELYGHFKKWYIATIDEDGKWFPTRAKVGLALKKKGFKPNVTGDRRWYGITVLEPEALF